MPSVSWGFAAGAVSRAVAGRTMVIWPVMPVVPGGLWVPAGRGMRVTAMALWSGPVRMMRHWVAAQCRAREASRRPSGAEVGPMRPRVPGASAVPVKVVQGRVRSSSAPGGGRPGGVLVHGAAGTSGGTGGQGRWMPGSAKWSSGGSPRAGFQSAWPGGGGPVSR